MADVDLKRPDDRLTIQFQDSPRELFMSFRRLNACLRILGDPQQLPMLMLDPDASEMIVDLMLAEKPNAAEALKEPAYDEGDLSQEDYDRVLVWTVEHLTHFFMRRFQQLGQTTKELGPLAEALKLSVAGSETSASNDPSAGPSA